ncbi:hypothetical protein LWM68_09865 [Niabella sp. W65]|nr:hypothetical protein [Niabella sp. W65]MCH7363047.1 hypothetical protein [Niabella sp. W65]
MHANSRSIYNCTYPPEELALPAATNTRLTYNPNTGKLYVHLFNYPTDGKLVLPGYKGKVKYAQLLNDASEVQFTTAGSDIELKLPGKNRHTKSRLLN